MPNIELIGHFSNEQKIKTFWRYHLSASRIKNLIKQFDNSGNDKWESFKIKFKENKHKIPLHGSKIPPREKGNVNYKTYANVGILLEKDILDKLKTTTRFKDLKIDKQRIVNKTHLIDDLPFFSSEIDGFIGKDLLNVEEIIEVKISKYDFEKVKEIYHFQFQALMWLLNTDILWLAHFHNIKNGKLKVVKIKKDPFVFLKIEKILKEIQK